MPSAIVTSWHVRARAYRELAGRYPIFEAMARRLVATAPPGFAGTFVDVGGGFGLVTALALEAFPAARAVLVEPAAAMRDLAREETARFGARVEVVGGDAETLPARGFGHAFANAVMHLVDETAAFVAAGRALAPGAAFAFNLWGHSFADAPEDPDPAPRWKAALAEALDELGVAERPPERSRSELRRRTRQGLAAAAAAGGLELVSIDLHEDLPPVAFHLDFAAMSPDFLPGLAAPLRAEALDRARARVSEALPMTTARVVVRKR